MVTEHSLPSRNRLIILTLVLRRSISQANENTRNRSSSSSSVSYLLDTRKLHLCPRAVDHFCTRFETGRPARRVHLPNLRYHSTKGVIVGHHLSKRVQIVSFKVPIHIQLRKKSPQVLKTLQPPSLVQEQEKLRCVWLKNLQQAFTRD
jgi:hypothetical protein